jgi:hypothetical protein
MPRLRVIGSVRSWRFDYANVSLGIERQPQIASEGSDESTDA